MYTADRHPLPLSPSFSLLPATLPTLPYSPRSCSRVTAWLSALRTRILPLCADSSPSAPPQEGESCPSCPHPTPQLREHTEACADRPPWSACPPGIWQGRLRARAQGAGFQLGPGLGFDTGSGGCPRDAQDPPGHSQHGVPPPPAQGLPGPHT